MRGAGFKRTIEEAVARDGVIKAGERVLIACSGGSDSVALAAILHAVAKPMRLQLQLGHVNHGARDSSWQDEAVVLRVAAALELPLRIAQLDRGAADEATLREGRYTALAALAGEANARVIATAHHAEDQTETVLLSLFRGTGLEGLAGMPARRALRDTIDLARPLLRFARAELRSYVHVCALPYAIDPSNADLGYRRNALREALEPLRGAFAGLDAAVARAAAVVSGELEGHSHAALRRRVREALREAEALEGVDFTHIEAAARALARGRKGRFSMGSGVEVSIERGALQITHPGKPE